MHFVAMQTEQVSLEAKNHELIDAFKEKSRAHQQIQKLYQALKAQVMASHVANAAGDEAELTLQTAQADRYITRLPGTRTGTANLNQIGVGQQAGLGRPQNRQGSRSSGSSELRQGGIRIGSPYVAQGRVGGTQTRGKPTSFQLLWAFLDVDQDSHCLGFAVLSLTSCRVCLIRNTIPSSP